MDRDEVERVERELDEILNIVQPDRRPQGSDKDLTGEKMQNRQTERPETDEQQGEGAVPGAGRRTRPGHELRPGCAPMPGPNPRPESQPLIPDPIQWLDEDYEDGQNQNYEEYEYNDNSPAGGDGQDLQDSQAAEYAEPYEEENGEEYEDGYEDSYADDFQEPAGLQRTGEAELQRSGDSRPRTPRRPSASSAQAQPPLRLLKPSDGLVAAFFVPVIVMIIIFAQRGIFPFGEESFLRTDMYHQYAPFFSEFQHKLTQGGSLLYSWDIGMGVNFSALYAYYLASPLNWLLILCPKNYIIEFMSYGIVLKIGLAGLSFAWYLRRHCKTQDFGVGFFGIFYALSGYMAAYSWNIMWLDCIILFPLIMLGLEQLVREKKPFLYCFALGASILSNYYISIMICIFMVMYFAALLVIYPPKGIGAFFGACLRFAVFSLVAGGLAAVVLLPEIYALQATASGNFDFPKSLSTYFSIFDMLARHIGNVGTEIGLDHWPNIYCGVAVFLFFLLYLANRKIPVREKAVYCVLLVLFYASFSTNMLNFIWHGFHYPNSLPCRQSFIYIALMLVICYRAYMYLGVTPWKHVAIAFWGSAAFVILAEKLVNNSEQFHFSIFYVALLFLALYAGLIYLYQNRKRGTDLIILAALAVVAIEAAVNTTVTSVPTTSRTAYTKDNKDVLALMKEIHPETFYRVEKVERKTKNDGAWMNFPSVSLFSSTADASLSDFFRRMGCESSTNAYSITGSTPLVDSLLSVRYGLYGSERTNSDLVSFTGRRGDTWLYENLYTLPVAFMLPEDVESNWILDSGNPATVQNDLSKVLDAAPVLVPCDTVPSGSKLTFTPEETGLYYVYVTNRKTKEVTAVIGTETKNFDNLDRGYLMELGICPAGEIVTLEAKDDSNMQLQAEVWRFSTEGLKEVTDRLNRHPMTVTRWTDTEIEGNIAADAPGVMYTSIPYDKGWSVKVDGNPVTPRKLFDTFIGVDLAAGAHTVVLTYEPQGLRTGALITMGSAAFAGISGIVYVTMNRKKRREE